MELRKSFFKRKYQGKKPMEIFELKTPEMKNYYNLYLKDEINSIHKK